MGRGRRQAAFLFSHCRGRCAGRSLPGWAASPFRVDSDDIN